MTSALWGRPPHYNTPEELQAKIDEYFTTWHWYRKIVTKEGNAIEIPYFWIVDLCLYLWFCDRASFYDYEKRDGFSNTIKWARSRIETEYEKMLHAQPTWAIFALKNFWRRDERTNRMTWEDWWPIQIQSILNDIVS